MGNSLKHDPPTSEKAYDDAPASKLKAAQGPVAPGKTSNMATVARVADGVGDEPMHDRASDVLRRGAKHLASHSHDGIHKVV